MKKPLGSRKAARNVKPQDILAEHTPEVRALAESLRRLILETLPNVLEVAYPVWHGIGYRHPESGYLCGIFPQQDSVKLGFEFGVLLPDSDGLLEGAGKQVRYVTIRESKDIRVDAIKRLLRAAIDLAKERDTKLWIAKSLSRSSHA